MDLGRCTYCCYCCCCCYVAYRHLSEKLRVPGILLGIS